MSAPNWLLDMRDGIWEWMVSLRDPEYPGRFQWCKAGSVIRPSHETGLGTSALALKVGYQINRLADVDTEKLGQWADYICSFQKKPPHRHAGFFEDRLLLRIADRNAGWFKKDIMMRRAETRQACAALLGAGTKPRFPVLQVPGSPEAIGRYLNSLPWEKNPWSAGSHAGHLMFFVKMNADVFGICDGYERLAPVILGQLDNLQDETTGSWFVDDPPIPQKVNAAMKILLIYDLIAMRFRWPERLIDLCLAAANENDACHAVDIIYVLHQCSRWTSHRRGDIRAFAERKLDFIRNHVKSDGAFSFFPDRTGTDYYGLRVARGLPESDIHGTHLLVWLTTLIADLLGFRKELGWNLPVT